MIRALIVDDSALSRRAIGKILESIPDVQVIDTATDGQDALKKTIRLQPDLITLDLAMPNMDGFTFLRWVMGTTPRPVIVVSSQEANEQVFKALDLGALDFVLKPAGSTSTELEQMRSSFLEKVLAIPLFRESRTREKMEVEQQQIKEALQNGKPPAPPQLIGIVASTGGPPAIQSILENLSPDLNVPVVIAQHMPCNFTSLFAQRLNRCTPLNVQEASRGGLLKAGNVYVAPGGTQIAIRKVGGQFQIEMLEQAAAKYQPSGDFLFQTMAEAAGSRTIGVVLTGMGDDGVNGLKAIKREKGITIAESRRSAAIFGMPGEAIRAGVVDYVLPLHLMAMAFRMLCDSTAGFAGES
jgi:two-component system chemotaxis response regulator CheB